jgi:hypothetical protein
VSVAFDPVVVHALAAAVALVLLVAAMQKLRDLPAFAAAVEQYRLLPLPLVWPVTLSLPVAEAAAGVMLLFEGTRTPGAALSFALVGFVTLAVSVNVARGRVDIDCGCGGIEGRQRLSWGLVARNAVLMAAALAAGGAPAPRALQWVDRVTEVAGMLALFAAWGCASLLIANRAMLARLRSQR